MKSLSERPFFRSMFVDLVTNFLDDVFLDARHHQAIIKSFYLLFWLFFSHDGKRKEEQYG